ncbi:odorant receptor 4 [Cephus cinctus]|uniref:Odorant receptor 4 n=1 Tax=Cephus cinctus TaxID=211228 RepID=A0AAJ7RTD1_CEPCN|nr:odorant receptor 4 [Cephus cinctus]
MPYHIRLFFNLTEARTYYIVYACEIFMIPLVTCGYAGPSCLLITLVLHICGQVSILTCQVENLIKNPETIHHQLKQIVLKHRRLINLCMNLNSTYATFLLQELIGITLLLCLGGYNIIATPILDETGHFLAFLLYTVTVIFQLLGFCYIGECLRNESKSLCDAFYNYEWYDEPRVNVKLFLMCVTRSQRPLVLTAGEFFIFSLENFTSVMKTSMAYLSVLRKFI